MMFGIHGSEEVGAGSRLRQCRKSPSLMRRNIPMPHAARLHSRHCAAFNSSDGRLVTSATVSGACWRR